MFAQRFNGRYERYGHVFQGPDGAVLLEDDDHLLEVCRYIALNPVRAGLVATRATGLGAATRPWPGSPSRRPSFDVELAHRLLGGAAGYRTSSPPLHRSCSSRTDENRSCSSQEERPGL